MAHEGGHVGEPGHVTAAVSSLLPQAAGGQG